VTGRPHSQLDQGSVENVNKFIKGNIVSILEERRQAGEDPNWTEVLGSVAAVINAQHGRGKNDVGAYEAVYGQEETRQTVISVPLLISFLCKNN
jgi:hypothetical protein